MTRKDYLFTAYVAGPPPGPDITCFDIIRAVPCHGSESLSFQPPHKLRRFRHCPLPRLGRKPGRRRLFS